MSTSCSLRLTSVENCALCSRGRLRSTSAVSPSGLFFPAGSLFNAWTKFVASKPSVSTLVSFSLEFSQLLIAAAASFCVSLQPAEVLKVFCQQALWSDFFPLQQFVQSHAQTWSWARSCSAVLLCFVSVFSLQLLFSSVCVFSRSVCSFFVFSYRVSLFFPSAHQGHTSRVFPAWQRCFCFIFSDQVLQFPKLSLHRLFLLFLSRCPPPSSVDSPPFNLFSTSTMIGLWSLPLSLFLFSWF